MKTRTLKANMYPSGDVLRRPDEVFSMAPIPELLHAAWPAAVAMGLLATSSTAMACSAASWLTTINLGGPPYAVVPGGNFQVRARYWYSAPSGCGNRARVRYISGSCNNIDSGWVGPGAACSCGGDTTQTYTMSGAPTQVCVIRAEGTNTCGDTRSQDYTVGITQVITVDTAAPAGPRTYGSTFQVAAHATSGYNVAVTTGGGCTGSGNTTGAGSPVTITMSSGTTSCVVYYNQAGGGQWNAAAQVTSTTTAQKANQTITVTTPAPGSAEMGAVFNVAATATSGLAVTATGSGGCSGTGTGTVPITMTSGTTTCTVTYSQAGDANYNAAPNVSSTTSATMANQYINVTTAPPAAAVNGQSFTVAAESRSVTYNALTGLGVSITSSGSCTGSGTNSTNITMNAGSGVCTITFSQPGVANNWNAATSVTKYVTALATSCNGEGTYTGIRLDNSNGYLGWACNGGSISCSPSILDWSIQPGIGFKGHVLQTELNPGKTIKIQAAPDGSGYYNVINQTDNTCWSVGNAIYECGGTRTGSNCNAGYLSAIQDTATLPGAPCNYNADPVKWQIVTDGSYMKLKTNGNVGGYGNHCIGTDVFGLSRLLLPDPDNFGDWGDVWVRNALPDCSSNGARLVCSGYAPPTPNHIRFEFDPSAATGFAQPVTIKSCTNARGAVGTNPAPTCSPYVGTILLTPVVTEGTPNGSASWSGLTASPATLFTTTSSGIKMNNTQAESVSFSYTNPSVALTDAVLECVNTVTNTVVDCTFGGGGGMTFGTGAFWIFEHGQTFLPAATTPTPHVYTKLANVAFPNSGLDIKAGRTVGTTTTVLTSYTGSPTIDIVEVTSNPLGANNGCSTGVTALTNPAQSDYPPGVAAAFTAGTLTVQPTVKIPKAVLRVRVTDGTNQACSDTFTVRPTEFSLTLTNSGSPLISGQSSGDGATGFTLAATARTGWNVGAKASTANVTTSGYERAGGIAYGYGAVTPNVSQINDWTTTTVNISGVPTAVPETPIPTSGPAPGTNVAGGLWGAFGAFGGNPLSASGTFYFDNFGVVNFNFRDTVADKTYTNSVITGLNIGGVQHLSDQANLDTVAFPNPPNANSYDCILTLPTTSDYDNRDPSNRTNPASIEGNAYSNVPGTVAPNTGKYGCYAGSPAPGTNATSRFRPGYYQAASNLTSAGTCGFTYAGNTLGAGTVQLVAKTKSATTMSLLNTGASSSPSFYVEPYDLGQSVTASLTLSPVLPLVLTPSTSWASGQWVVNPNAYTVSRGTPFNAYDGLVYKVTVDDPDSVRITPSLCTDGLLHAGSVADAGTKSTCTPPITTYNANGTINTQKGSTRVRFGQLKLENAYGSERLPLDVPVKALFRNSSGGWEVNTLDSTANGCTSQIPNTAVAFGNFKGQLASNQSAIVVPTISTFTSGMATMRFAAPTGNYTGSFDVALNLGGGATIGSSSCTWTLPAVPTHDSSTAGSAWAHLMGAWCGATYNRSPSARITFGAAKAPYLYRREKF